MALEILVNTGSGNGLCLTAPSHYLSQCWLIISKVLWHSSEDIIIRRFEDTNQYNKIENNIFKITLRSPSVQWVKLKSRLIACGPILLLHYRVLCKTLRVMGSAEWDITNKRALHYLSLGRLTFLRMVVVGGILYCNRHQCRAYTWL